MPATAAPASEVRARVMGGLVAAVETKGYNATTVGDIARAAKISRRTLYEHFDDKEGCFLACYSAMADELISQVRAAASDQEPGLDQLRAAIGAYLALLVAAPVLTRTFFTEINAVGARGLQLRFEVSQRWSELMGDLLRDMRDNPAAQLPRGFAMRAPSTVLTIALVGAVNEVVLMALVESSIDQTAERLSGLSEPILSLVESMVLEPVSVTS